MTLADVNVMLAALRPDHTDHKRCHAWLTAQVNGTASFGVAPQVLSSVIRIATNRRAFINPTSLENALAFSQVTLSAPNAIAITPRERHWDIFTELLREANAAGNLVPDAWFAALAIEHGCTWVTLDRDYARFKSLRIAAP